MIILLQTNIDNILWLCYRFMTVRKDTASGKVGDDKSGIKYEPAKLHENVIRHKKAHWQEQIRGKRQL